MDEHGFDEIDRRLLRTIIDKFAGGPVGLNTISAAISEEKDAIEDIYEPFLIQIGFLDRTPRGRVATARAYEYFGLRAPGKDRDSGSGSSPAFVAIPRFYVQLAFSSSERGEIEWRKNDGSELDSRPPARPAWAAGA